MIRAIAQIILSTAGVVAAFFISPDSTNFSFIQMVVALLMIIFCALAIWYVPSLFRQKKRSRHR